jgi:thiamine pyrophosphate-dependent acetolactate synthase large subunit-like protein
MWDRNRSEEYSLRRREVVEHLIKDLDDLLIVAGLGAPAWDITAAGDRPLNYPLWGAMGGAAMIGLGLALAQPERRVLVITGDGDMLMGLGSLATIALQRPTNLSIIVLDNERYGETGMQATHTAGPIDLAAVAHACGFEQAATIYNEDEFDQATPAILEGEGPMFFDIKIRAEEPPLILPPRDGAHLKDRFRVALLGPEKGVNPTV